MIPRGMTTSKKQDLPSGIWVVATPIGNLSDLTERARRALGSAGKIACEDTRETLKLLSALGIERPEGGLTRLDAHSGPREIEALLEWVEEGPERSVALVTDAGTPGISDPGARLVAAARARGVQITPVPGASAVATLLSAAGFDETAYAFLGFFPRKSIERRKLLGECERSPVARVFVWFESPHRIAEALAEVAEAVPGATVLAAKELTKLHERFFAGDAAEANSRVADEIGREGEKGEWAFAVRFQEAAGEDARDSSEWLKTLKCLLDAQVSASEAARQVSQHFGVARKPVYEAALRISGKKV